MGVATVLREFTPDLLRAMESAALAETAGELAPERRGYITTCLFAETKARYAISAAATLATLGSGGDRRSEGYSAERCVRQRQPHERSAT